jgi:tetratricopeptide (TPR) repeat protein
MGGHPNVTARGLDEAYFLDLVGDACNNLGHYGEAVDAFAQAVKVFKDHGAQYAHALCLLKLAQCHLALGHSDEAVRYLQECLPSFRDLQMRASEERALLVLRTCVGG